MMGGFDFCINRGTSEEIFEHLQRCDSFFIPPLSHRLVLMDYAHKISIRAERFEAWVDDELIGLVATYFNRATKVAFVTSVSVLPQWGGHGVGSSLMSLCIENANKCDFERIELEVDLGNTTAVKLYEKLGFLKNIQLNQSVMMCFVIRK